MRLVLENGPLRALVDVAVSHDWQVEKLADRTRLTHRLGTRLELCATDLPSWPPSAIRKHFTASYREDEIEIIHSSGLEGSDGEPIVYKLMYVPKGARMAPEKVLITILDSVRVVPLDRIRILMDES